MKQIFVFEVGNGQSSRNGERNKKETSVKEHPLFMELERGIELMKRDIAKTTHELKLLERLRNEILEACGEETKPPVETEAPKKPVKSEKTENTSGNSIETKSTTQSPEKIDAEPSDDLVNPQLKHLKKEVSKALKTVRGTPLAKRVKKVKLMIRTLSAAGKPGPELTDMERIARIEAAIGDALSFLQTSKLAARTKVLKEVKQILEDTIDKRNKQSETNIKNG